MLGGKAPRDRVWAGAAELAPPRPPVARATISIGPLLALKTVHERVDALLDLEKRDREAARAGAEQLRIDVLAAIAEGRPRQQPKSVGS
jgi:hypothetical protein